MIRRSVLAALVLALPACPADPGSSTSAGSSTSSECPDGSEGCPCAENSSCQAGLVCAAQVCVSDDDTSSTSGDPSASSSGEASTTSASTGPIDASTSTSSSSATGDESTDAASDSGSSAPTDPTDPQICGDDELDEGEECDDGNVEDGDGCSSSCVVERWTHEGVATDVPLAALKKWKSCFSATYEAGPKVADILADCNGDHILMGCLPVGGKALTIAAHAPREDVFAEVNYDAGERHLANGVAWYWAPYYGDVGFGPDLGEDFWNPCEKAGEDSQMCWGVGGNMPLALVAGRRCGATEVSSGMESKAWLRVIYESWD